MVEAALPSGSLLTARSALEQGREVFAVPWSPLHEGGRGCLELLRDGAKMVLELRDVLEELPLAPVPEGSALEVDDSAALLRLIGFEAVALEQLLALSDRPVEVLQSQLASLELAGEITRTAGGFIRT